VNLNLHYSEILPHPVERVWAAVTSAEGLREWLMESDFMPKIGASFKFRCSPRPGHRGWIQCSVLELVPQRRIVWSWLETETGEPTRVTIELEAVPGGTRFTLTHRGDTTPDLRSSLEAGWPGKLASLRQALVLPPAGTH
jgi:uncharacterized protein YndB with AHSA1/START domain